MSYSHQPRPHADPNEVAKTGAIDFAYRLAGRWREALGAELIGAYLIGSLAHAGFSRRYSDIDMALVTADGLSTEALALMRGQATALSPEWGPRVSVFWTDRAFSRGRFLPLDRIDYLDHGVALFERECVRPARPTLGEIHDYLRGAPFADWASRARAFAAAEVLERKNHKAYLRALLYPGRLCYSWITGRIASSDAAVAFLSEANVPMLDLDLIKRALQCRQAAADPDALFPERTALPAQVEACAALLAADCGALR